MLQRAWGGVGWLGGVVVVGVVLGGGGITQSCGAPGSGLSGYTNRMDLTGDEREIQIRCKEGDAGVVAARPGGDVTRWCSH